MGDMDAILAEVRFLATRGEHHADRRALRPAGRRASGRCSGTRQICSTRSAAPSACSATRTRSNATCCAAPSWRRAAPPSSTAGSAGTSSARRSGPRRCAGTTARWNRSRPTTSACSGAATASRSSIVRARPSRRCSGRARRLGPGRTRAAAARPWRPGPGAVPSVPCTARPGRIRGRRARPSTPCRHLDAETDPPAIRPEHLLASHGELLMRRGDLHGARELFEQAREIDPTRATSGNGSAGCTSCAATSTTAEAAYRRAATLPRGAFAFLSLGRLHTEVTHDHRAAATALAEALRQVQSAEPLVRLELARLQLALGRPHAALAQMEQALACRREGGFPEAPAARCRDWRSGSGSVRRPPTSCASSSGSHPTTRRSSSASSSSSGWTALRPRPPSTLRYHRASRCSPTPA